MKKCTFFRCVLSFVLVLCMTFSYVLPAYAAEDDGISFEKVDNSTVKGSAIERETVRTDASAESFQDNDDVRVSIVLNEDSTLSAGYSSDEIASNEDAMNYRNNLKKEQKSLEKKISKALGKSLDVQWNLTLAANIISADVKFGDIEDIKAVEGVQDVVVETKYYPCRSEETADPDMAISSSNMTGTISAWTEGYTGAGARIAIIDTGLDVNHQSFNNDAFLYSLEQNAAHKGVKYKSYLKSLRLLDSKYISKVMKYLNVNTVSSGSCSAEDLYLSEKIPFAFNYVDANLNVSHEKDTESEHGSHVAGIAAANRYLKTDDGYESALESVYVAGNAPDAQVLVMKVFGENGGAYDSDYMAAIEDSILLGCDSVNLSLGSSQAGMTTNSTYQDILDKLSKTNTVVVMSAGNNGAWADESSTGDLYADDVNYHTGGSPGTYENALTVASVDNDGMIGYTFEVNGKAYNYTETQGYGNALLSTLASEEDSVYDYVFVDGIGIEDDYTDIDLTGKVVFCKRGEISFTEKANMAASLGAAAVIIYNNTSGSFGMDLTGYEHTAPVVSISQEDAASIKAASQKAEGNGTVYYTGTITICADIVINKANAENYTMSSFSSWGVPGDLTLKPEITAPGGNIYSVAGTNLTADGMAGGTDQYEQMSGTSMAAPQISGMTAVLMRYIEENHLFQMKTNRALAQSLLMSTAVPMISPDGYIYSPIQQGAGLANVSNAINAATCIFMDRNACTSSSDGKVKAELGDDPDKTGVYTFRFTMNNLTRKKQTYDLSADVFTQNTDGEYLYGSTTDIDAAVTFKINGKTAKSVTVSPRGSRVVTVTIKLTDKTKALLDSKYINGAYVEAYVYAVPADGRSSAHSIPVLGYYGNWTDASMFDKGSYLEYAYGTENRVPYLYDYNDIFGNAYSVNFAGDSGEYLFGGNLYAGEEEYLPERNALNNQNGDYINSVYYSLIRNAGDRTMVISNAATGDVYLSGNLGEQYAAFYNSNSNSWAGTQSHIGLNWSGTDADGNPLPEGTTVNLTLTAVPEYYRTSDGTYDMSRLGKGADFSTQLTIDNTAPALEVVGDDKNSSIYCSVSDNQYVAAVLLYAEDGEKLIARYGVGTASAKITLGENLNDDVYLVQVLDYAGNASTYRIFLNTEETTDVSDVTISETVLQLVKNNTVRLTAKANPKELEDRGVTWSSSDEAIATVDKNGLVTAVSAGKCVITAASVLNPEKTAECQVTVIEIDTDLNGFVWDENGGVWFSQFNTSGLPEYQKLSSEACKAPLASMTYGADGTLYAASLDTEAGTSNVYTVNPETFEITQTGKSSVAYTDMAAAPNLAGGCLIATYFNYILLVDPVSGEYMGAFDYSSNNLVGITYCGSQFNETYNTDMDLYYLLDDKGNIYLEAFIDTEEGMGYFLGEEDGLSGSTGITCDTPYFQSLYFDGNYTFVCCFNQGKNSVTMYAVDTENTGSVYKLGSFADGVWPVGGLTKLQTDETEATENAADLAKAQTRGTLELQNIEPVTMTVSK